MNFKHIITVCRNSHIITIFKLLVICGKRSWKHNLFLPNYWLWLYLIKEFKLENTVSCKSLIHTYIEYYKKSKYLNLLQHLMNPYIYVYRFFCAFYTQRLLFLNLLTKIRTKVFFFQNDVLVWNRLVGKVSSPRREKSLCQHLSEISTFTFILLDWKKLRNKRCTNYFFFTNLRFIGHINTHNLFRGNFSLSPKKLYA